MVLVNYYRIQAGTRLGPNLNGFGLQQWRRSCQPGRFFIIHPKINQQLIGN